MVTEDEAKTMWCPFVRHADVDIYTFNRGGGDNFLNEHPNNQGSVCNCIGSKCMAWRWNPESGGGYCGMGGAPMS